MRIDLTSAAFRNSDRQELLISCQRMADKCQVELGIQLHNSESKEVTQFLRQNRLPLSVHSPYQQELNWNFTVPLSKTMWHNLERAVDQFHEFEVTATVFHGFFMTDLPLQAFGHGRSYEECMSEILRPELTRYLPEAKCAGLNIDFTHSVEYFQRQQQFKKNLQEIRQRWPEIVWCVENDLPVYGSGDMLPENLSALDNPICFDTSHFWLSAKLLNYDFQVGVNEFVATHQVKMVHFHASPYRLTQSIEDWGDGHQVLDIPNDMDLPEVAKKFFRAGCEHFVLEIPKLRPRDIELLSIWCNV